MPRASRAAVVTATGVMAAMVTSAGPVAQTRPQGPVATYWATAETSTGIAGGSIDPMALLSGGGARRDLHLELESRLAPSGTPSAEHLPPEGLKAGPSLPLRSPRTTSGLSPRSSGEFSGDAPKGRMLIYWGCGETVRPGQPLVVDFAHMTGQSLPDLGVREPVGPSAGGGRTYGEWPNETTRTRVPQDGSLVGDHLVRGNYTPDIRFSLSSGQDFMGAFRLSGVSDHEQGAVPLGWQPISGAKAYFASTMGVADSGDMIVWSSSEIAVSPGSMPTHLSPADIQALLKRQVILSPQTTRCAIPAQVADAAPEAMLRMIGFGGEVNFSFPPRPADPKAPWAPEHVVKVRYASIASTILGMPDLSEAAGEADEGPRAGPLRAGSLNADPPSASPLSASPLSAGSLLGAGLGGLLRGSSLPGASDTVRSLLKRPARRPQETSPSVPGSH